MRRNHKTLELAVERAKALGFGFYQELGLPGQHRGGEEVEGR